MILLSHILTSDTPNYGNRNKLIIKQKQTNSDDVKITESEWYFSTNHFGTHIDVPKHFIKDGFSITDFNEDFWIFNNIELINIHCNIGRLIEFEEVDQFIKDKRNIELILIRTGYERYRGTDKYWQDNPGISSNCAELLVKRYPKLRGIGFDFISLTSFNYREDGKKAHFNIFKDNKEFIIIEDMKLSKVYTLLKQIVVAPLFIKMTDGSPVTVFAY